LEFWGQPVPTQLVADIEGLLHRMESKDSIASELGEMLTGQEIKAIKKRLQVVLDDPVLPKLDPYHNVPWPWM